VLNVKLKVAVMPNVLCFVLKLGDDFLRWFPIGGNNTARKIIKRVWRDGEVLRREGVITVEVVQALQRAQITFNNVPRDAVVWNVVQIKV